MSKIYNSGLDHLAATHFLALLQLSLGFGWYFGNHWARSTNRCVMLWRQASLFLTLLKSHGNNWFWLRFRNYTTVFILRVDWLGKTYAGFFRGHVGEMWDQWDNFDIFASFGKLADTFMVRWCFSCNLGYSA